MGYEYGHVDVYGVFVVVEGEESYVGASLADAVSFSGGSVESGPVVGSVEACSVGAGACFVVPGGEPYSGVGASDPAGVCFVEADVDAEVAVAVVSYDDAFVGVSEGGAVA